MLSPQVKDPMQSRVMSGGTEGFTLSTAALRTLVSGLEDSKRCKPSTKLTQAQAVIKCMKYLGMLRKTLYFGICPSLHLTIYV